MKWARPQRLEIRQLIGQGWAGDVHVAHSLEGGDPVAVRLISAERVPEIGRLMQLLQPGASLGLPGVLPTSLPEAFDGQLFYAMPLADQGSLRTVLERVAGMGSHLDPLTALDLTRQVAEALSAAHVQGTVHGNLKPENVLLWARPPEGFTVRLSDFGLNALRVPDARNPYLSPEGRLGAPTSVQDDLFSVGSMLFEMLTGQALPLIPQPIDLQGFPEVLRKLLGRCFGWPMPFSDAAAFLGQLRAVRAVVEASLLSGGVQLLLDPPALNVQPGTPQTMQVRLSGTQEAAVLLEVENWPENWVKLPTPPALPVRAGAELVTSVGFLVPRSPEILPRTYEASVLALQLLPGGERQLLARAPVQLTVLPFSDSALELLPVQREVGRNASVQLSLTNLGNAPQKYHLAVNLPPGVAARSGSLERQFELQPGAEYHDELALRLPAALLQGREIPVSAVAHTARPSEGSGWLPSEDSVQASTRVWQRPTVPWWSAALLGAVLLGGTFWAAQPPRIQDFGLVGSAPARGEPFTLAWQTAGARQVELSEVPDVQLPGGGARQLPGVQAEQTYTLVARGWLTRRTAQVRVVPTLPLPRVASFSVSPPSAKVGQLVTVRWDVKDAAQVTVTPFGVVPAEGSRQVKMTKDMVFTLTAQQDKTPGRSDVVSRVSASVGAPQIQVFSITPGRVQRGQPVTVRWQVSGAQQVRMSPLGTLPAAGSRTFVPQQTTDYVLKASNGQQEAMSSAVVTVQVPQTGVQTFTVSPSNPAVGDPVTFKWATTGAKRVSLRWGDQQQVLPPSGTLTLNATTQMQNATLVAQGDGQPVLKTAQLHVRQPVTLTPVAPAPAASTARPAPTAPQPNISSSGAAQLPSTQKSATPPPTTPTPATSPRITRFTASVGRVAVGGRTTLSWQASGQGRVTLIGPDTRIIGRFGPRGSQVVTVGQAGSQTYRLVSGEQVVKVVVVGVPRAANMPQSAPPRPAVQASPQPASPASPPVTVRPEIQLFRAQPAALRPGQSATLSWKVSGVRQVNIRGLRGPNPDGSFPAVGTVQTPAASAAQTFVLSVGTVQQTLRIPLLAGAAQPEAGGVSTSSDSTYAALSGTWRHPFGQLELTVRGNRVTGTLTSSRDDLPGGSFRGTLSGGGTSPTLNGFVTSGGERVALLLSFDSAAQTFRGFYSSRASRERWCGWRGDNVQDCQ